MSNVRPPLAVRQMNTSRQRLRRYAVVLSLWCISVGVHAWLYVSAVLARSEEITEWYARSVSFQLIAFSIVALPYWLLGLLVAMLAVRYFPVQRRRGDAEA